MDIANFIGIKSYVFGRVASVYLPILTVFSVILAQYYVFVIAPDEAVMGAVQRIFYFHVGAALSAYAMIFILLVGSSFYLLNRRWQWDVLAESAASVGFLLCSVVLLSGMIWGHSAWNTWWRWEPRLVSFLVLWMLLFSYVLLRNFSAELGQQGNFSAILGIVSAVNVPIVIFSIRILDRTEQLHPQVVSQLGLHDSSYVDTLLLSCVAVFLLSIWMMCLSIRNLLLKREIAYLYVDASIEGVSI